MAACDDDDVGVRGNGRALHPRGDVVGDDLRRIRKALGVRELLAIVDDMDPEADFVGEPRQVEADVPGADDVQLGRRLDRLDVDVHLSAADEAGLLGEIVGQLVVDELRPAVGDRLPRLPERVVLVAPAANRPDDAPVAEHQHLGAHALRRRAGRGDDRDERGRLAALERVGDGGEDFLVHGLRGL